jgi:hypothetical protein
VTPSILQHPLGSILADNRLHLFRLTERQALCTEASLNAIQRRYPQIYKTNDRLLLEPESISVQAKDFMISIKSAFFTPPPSPRPCAGSCELTLLLYCDQT